MSKSLTYKKISQLEQIDDINDQQLLLQKYIQNGIYKLQLIDIEKFSENINNNFEGNVEITVDEIREQEKILSSIDLNLQSIINIADKNNISLNSISSLLSTSCLSTYNDAEESINKLSYIEDCAISNINLLTNAQKSLENDKQLFDSFNETFKTLNFNNLNQILSINNILSINISKLSANFNNLSTEINTKISNCTIPDTNLLSLSLVNNNLSSTISNISSIITEKYDIIRSYEINEINETDNIDISIPITITPDNNHILIQFIAGKIYEITDSECILKQNIDNFKIISIDNELSANNISNETNGNISVQIPKGKKYRILLTYIQRPIFSQ